jgi:hypothetical protein
MTVRTKRPSGGGLRGHTMEFPSLSLYFHQNAAGEIDEVQRWRPPAGLSNSPGIETFSVWIEPCAGLVKTSHFK